MDLSYFKDKLNIREEKTLFVIQAINFNKLLELEYLLDSYTYKEKDILIFLIIAANLSKKDIIRTIINNENLLSYFSHNSMVDSIKNKLSKEDKSTRINFLNNLILDVNENKIKSKLNNF